MKKFKLTALFLAIVSLSACEKSILDTPTGVQGQQVGNRIMLAWNMVEGANCYEIKSRAGYKVVYTTTFTDEDPVEGFNSYVIEALNDHARSKPISINVFYSANSSNDNGGGTNPGGGGTNPDGNTQNESVVLTRPTVSNITSSSARISYNIEYSAANLTAVGIMYARASNLDYQFVSLSEENLATLQKSTNGNYSITFNLASLNAGTQYVVNAFAATSKRSYSSSDNSFTTTSSSSSGGGSSGNLTVNKTNLTGTWTCTFNGSDKYYWVLQSSGSAYSIVDESAYLVNGTYHKYVGTWTVGSSSFTFKQTRYYYYYAGTLDYSESDSSTETVTIKSLTSTQFVDGDGNTWTKTTLPSYINL